MTDGKPPKGEKIAMKQEHERCASSYSRRKYSQYNRLAFNATTSQQTTALTQHME
jgi:hypothetical protein